MPDHGDLHQSMRPADFDAAVRFAGTPSPNDVALRERLAEAEAILRDIVGGWPNDDPRFDAGMAAAEIFLGGGPDA